MWGTKSSQIHSDRKSRMVVFRGWGEGREELVFNRYKVSGLQDEKTYGDGWWWWSHNNVNYLMPLKCALKNDYDGEFYHTHIKIPSPLLKKKKLLKNTQLLELNRVSVPVLCWSSGSQTRVCTRITQRACLTLSSWCRKSGMGLGLAFSTSSQVAGDPWLPYLVKWPVSCWEALRVPDPEARSISFLSVSKELPCFYFQILHFWIFPPCNYGHFIQTWRNNLFLKHILKSLNI